MMIISSSFLTMSPLHLLFPVKVASRQFINLKFSRYCHNQVTFEADKQTKYSTLTCKIDGKEIILKGSFKRMEMVFLKVTNMIQKKSQDEPLTLEEYTEQYVMSLESYKNDILTVDPKFSHDLIPSFYKQLCFTRHQAYLRAYKTANDPATIL